MRHSLAMLTLLTFVVPGAQAACSTGVTALCDAADKTDMDRLFHGYGDVGLALAALAAVAVLVSFLLLLGRGSSTKPSITVTAKETTKEVPVAGKVNLDLSVANDRLGTSTDVAVQVGELPLGWSADVSCATVYASGFSAPKDLPEGELLHLASAERPGHEGTVSVALAAPQSGNAETIEVPVKVVPVAGGSWRRRRARTETFSVSLTGYRSSVQISSVVHEPDPIQAGHPVLTRAVIANGGSSEEHEVGVALEVNDQALDRKVVPALAANQQTTVEFQWVPAHGENHIRIRIG